MFFRPAKYACALAAAALLCIAAPSSLRAGQEFDAGGQSGYMTEFVMVQDWEELSGEFLDIYGGEVIEVDTLADLSTTETPASEAAFLVTGGAVRGLTIAEQPIDDDFHSLLRDTFPEIAGRSFDDYGDGFSLVARVNNEGQGMVQLVLLKKPGEGNQTPLSGRNLDLTRAKDGIDFSFPPGSTVQSATTADVLGSGMSMYSLTVEQGSKDVVKYIEDEVKKSGFTPMRVDQGGGTMVMTDTETSLVMMTVTGAGANSSIVSVQVQGKNN